METVKKLIQYMKKENINKFSFKKSYMNKGYYYLKLINKNNFQIVENILLSEEQTEILFQQLYLKYPETILFKIHEIDFQFIEKQEKTIQNITKIKELIQQEQINKEKEIMILLNEIVENTTQI